MKKLIAAVVCIAFVQTASSQAVRSQSAATGKPFRVAWITGLTGPTAAQQRAGLLGAQIAAKVLNAQGGILGRPVEITSFDHQFDPARAVQLLQQDVLTQSWDLIYPGGGTLTTSPMLPFVAKAKILAIAPFLVADTAKLTQDNPTFFDIQPSPLDAAAAFGDYVAKRKIKKLGVLYQSDGYGVNTDKAYEAPVRKLGIPIVSMPYDIAAVDVTPALLKLKDENPDALFVVAFGAPAGHVLSSLDKLGWNLPIIGDLGMGITDLPALVPARDYAHVNVQVYRTNVYVPENKRSALLNELMSSARAAGPINSGLSTYTFGWDVIMLANLAAKRAGSTDEAKMVEAMEHLNLPPRQRTYLTYLDYNFTPLDHVVSTGPAEFPFVPYTPLSDGMVGGR